MKEKITTIKITDAAYPDTLRLLGEEAPQVLYCIGDVSLLKRRAAAIVGARKASQYGKWAASGAARKLAQHGIVVVSGMAYGCDSAAHLAALDAGGATIAVLGCGVDICYPKGNKNLRSRIVNEGGLLVSEYPPATTPEKYYFPRRNRIISGLSELTIVAEASLYSGSLITADHAITQGRNVMAVPGNITNAMSIGANKLIQDGAIPMVCIDDCLAALGISQDMTLEEDFPTLGADEVKVYEVVKENGEVTADFIAKQIQKTIYEVNGLITILEIKGVVFTSMGKICIAM